MTAETAADQAPPDQARPDQAPADHARDEAAAPRRRPARRGEGSQLRQEIVEAAGREIARTGDASTLTLRGVAREVGVAATSIYLHFPSVSDLVDEVKRCRFGDLQSELQAAADAAGDDPAERVRARARAYVRHGLEHPGEYAVMFTAKLVPAGATAHPPVVLASLEDLEVDLRALLAAKAADQRPADEPADDLRAEAHLLAIHIWTALHGTVTLRMLRPLLEWPDRDAQVDDLVGRLLSPLPHPR
jgi:AcrR family transcriptional regulator